MQERCAEARQFRGKEDLFECVHGVAAKRGVWRLRSAPPSSVNQDAVQDQPNVLIEAEEGPGMLRLHLRYEQSRSSKLIDDFKASLKSRACYACGFDFEDYYGELDAGYIEARHKVPVSQLKKGEKTRIDDLVPLCANCHRVIHRNGILPVELLKAQLGKH